MFGVGLVGNGVGGYGAWLVSEVREEKVEGGKWCFS